MADLLHRTNRNRYIHVHVFIWTEREREREGGREREREMKGSRGSMGEGDAVMVSMRCGSNEAASA